MRDLTPEQIDAAEALTNKHNYYEEHYGTTLEANEELLSDPITRATMLQTLFRYYFNEVREAYEAYEPIADEITARTILSGDPE